MTVIITEHDPRYKTLQRSRNLRWPASEREAASQIELCDDAASAADALQKIVAAGMRPTVRSGGHCYEDFVVNNPGGAILDLSIFKAPILPGDGGRYRISPGMQLGEVYLDLYKRYGVTIPAGSCYTVGAGGHISGGGYGVLSRLYGLTVDWLSEVEILTIDSQGKVIPRHVDKKNNPDLFRACCGAGGGNFGVITGFLFDKLPKAPEEVVTTGIGFDWQTMTEERFVHIVTTFGNYCETRGKDPDTWGLFAALELSHASSGRMGISLQFCNPDGTCRDLTVVEQFLKLFGPAHNARGLNRRPWLSATIDDSDSGPSGRAKYKSSYMRKNFTTDEAKCIYKHLTRKVPGVELRGSVLAVDSYGGATNRIELANETAVCQRSSIMKLQWQSYWRRPEDDAGRIQWLREFYNDLYSGPNVPARYSGTPYPGEYYEGCYINYPDSDMLAHPFWPQLYYGDRRALPVSARRETAL